MPIPVTQVDAFTDRPFRGNPAAVCLLREERTAEWMQNVAREMNLSETAFVGRHADGFTLRWFTPAVEVDLCGHATLASAHVLWESGVLGEGEQARFHTKSGLLTADRRGELIELDFPAKTQVPAEPPAGLAEALGARIVYFGLSRDDGLVELESDQAVRELRPDFGRLRALSLRAVMATARAASGEHDIVSRFFAPHEGIDEDPVTGSAHCCLGPLWGARLGKSDLVCYQASARGGTLRVGVRGERVLLGGKAVTVMTGQLVV